MRNGLDGPAPTREAPDLATTTSLIEVATIVVVVVVVARALIVASFGMCVG